MFCNFNIACLIRRIVTFIESKNGLGCHFEAFLPSLAAGVFTFLPPPPKKM